MVAEGRRAQRASLQTSILSKGNISCIHANDLLIYDAFSCFKDFILYACFATITSEQLHIFSLGPVIHLIIPVIL